MQFIFSVLAQQENNASIKPNNDGLIIPFNMGSVNVIFDPLKNIFFDSDGIKGTSNELTIDLGVIDFGVGKYNRIWVEMNQTSTIGENAKFDFYLDDELMQPKTELNIPLQIPVEPYDTDALPQEGLFFKNVSVEVVDVIDTRFEDNTSKMVCSVMQGVLNQTQAKIYLFAEQHHWDQLIDAKVAYRHVEKYSHKSYSGLFTMIREYGDNFEKLIVWDEDKEWTWCIAQMLSAQQKGIPVTLKIHDFIVNELGWEKPVEDIRNLWTDKLSAYNWAIDSLSVNCHPTLSFSAGLREDYKVAPWRIYDYAAASKGFVFWLNQDDPVDAGIIERLCNKMNYQVGSSTLGYGYGKDGDALNTAINKYNVGFIVSDYYSNGSYWCSFPGKAFKQRKGKALDAQPGKVYISFIWSDGDNVQFDANQLYYMFKYGKRRGEVPVGTTMAASLQELNPHLLEFFYDNMTSNDELLAGPSGFQFIYGDSFNPDTYEEWLEMNNKWLVTAGFNTACIWNTSDQIRFDRYMTSCGLQGVFDGWSRANNRLVNGVVAINQGAHCWEEGDVYNDIIKVNINPEKPVFRNVYLIAANYGGVDGYERLIRELERLEAYLPDTYNYLLPMDLSATLIKYISENGGRY